MSEPSEQVSIDSVIYPILRVNGALQWQVESEGQELEEVFTDWTRGLGIDYLYTLDIDASTPGLLRLRPSVLAPTGGGSLATTGTVGAFFEEMSVGGTRFLYFVGFQDAATDQLFTRKINLDTLAWVLDVNHFSGAFPAGRYGAGKPERFEKEWAVCWRDSTLGHLFKVLQDVGEATGSITGNTAANPTVVTAALAHNLQNGDTVVISGSNSTPTIDGTHTVSNVTASTFTVPVNVTTPGTAGTFVPQDTWVESAAGLFAGAFSQVQEEGEAKLARAYSTNLLGKATVDPELLASWASGFEVGDDSVPISTMFEIGGYIVVVKPDGVYLFDKLGFSYVAEMPLIRRRATSTPTSVVAATVDDWDGIGSTLWHKMLLLVHETGVYLVNPIGGGSPISIGPEALAGFCPRISGLESATPRDGRVTWAVTFGDNVYLCYQQSASLYWLLYGYPSEGKSPAPFIWHPIFFYTGFISCPFIDTDQRLWFIAASGSPLFYMQLTASGKPSTALGSARGTVSLDASIALLKDSKLLSFGQEGHQFQLRQIGVFVEGQTAYTSVTLAVARDGGSIESVGSAITTDGYSEVELTPGTTDLAHYVVPIVEIHTTVAYVPASSDPRIRMVIIRARTPDLVSCTIDMSREALLKYGLTPEEAEKNLKRLQNAGRKTIIEPGPNQTSYNGEIYAVSRKQIATDTGVYDALEVRHRRWSTA